MITALVLGLVVGAMTADARNRVRRPAEHYQYTPDHLTEKVRDYTADYDRVALVSELRTEVTEGQPICRLTWNLRRVDYFREGTESTQFEFDLPRGAGVDDVRAYRVDDDGTKGKRIDDVTHEVTNDSMLVVVVPELDGRRVVDLQLRLSGTGISVEEHFDFTPDFPVLIGEYAFAVSKDLLQSAADQGLNWEFTAHATPRTWEASSNDDPDFFVWYWRKEGARPVDPENPRSKDYTVSVSGFLPAPALAGFDPEKLPNIKSLHDILAFQERLTTDYDRGSDSFGGPGGGALGTSTGSAAPSLPDRVGKGR
jgi:hypothetical protein